MHPALLNLLLNGTPSWVLAEFGTAGIQPDLALDLQKGLAWSRGFYNGALDGFLGLTNASGGYVDDSNGNWTLKSANTLRRSDKYTLFEESRINSIRNNSMQGAVAGTPGTQPTNWVVDGTVSNLARQIVGFGTDANGIDYIDLRYSGTSNATSSIIIRFESSAQIVATNGQTWAASAFVSLVGGSLTGITNVGLNVRMRDSGGVNLGGTATTLVPSATVQRGSVIFTFNNASTAFASADISVTPANATAIDFTLRIGWPQLELGASVTSPIRTTNAAATRNLDLTTGITRLSGIGGSTFTFAAEFIPQVPVAFGSDQFLAEIDDGGDNNRITICRNNGDGKAKLLVKAAASVTANPLSGAVWAQNASGRLMGRFAPGDQAASLNGGTVFTAAAATIPVMTTLSIARDSGTGRIANGGLKKIAVWASGVPNSGLIAWSGATSP